MTQATHILPEPFEMPLWPDGVPGAQPSTTPERWFMSGPSAPFPFRQVRNVTQPTLTAFLPDPEGATGTAVVVCPGGAHHVLAMDHEGYDVARWLAERGVAAFVLKYRLIVTPEADEDYEAHMGRLMADLEAVRIPTRRHLPTIQADGQQAMRLVRENAQAWGLNPNRIGILGFSAGGHLATSVTLEHDEGSRPDFAAPIYGALWEDITVPENAPPLFLAYANNDELGDLVVGPNLRLYAAWRAAGKPVELHVYAQGGHGFGLWRQGLPSDTWIDRFFEWLQAQRLVTPRHSP